MDRRIVEFISENSAQGVLIVLKGYPLGSFCMPQMKISMLLDNKIGRLLEITQQDQQVISFDEFICLYDLLIMQYRKICIIENPVYHYLFPALVDLGEDTRNAILKHFDEDAADDTLVGDIGEYTNIYSNYLKTSQGIACCYNIDDTLLRHEKIQRFVFEETSQPLNELSDSTDDFVYINICNDTDYFELVQLLHSTQDLYAVTWESYLAGKDAIRNKIDILCAHFPNRVFAYVHNLLGKEDASDPEVLSLLEKYWGYTEYRPVKVYDLDGAANKQKKVVAISQEQIIHDLIEQAERCIDGKSFKDVFVTAPTGAGKSLMFQLPAIYLAEKYNLVTLVITPLIGLMNDQVQALSRNGYYAARTINSDISPIIKQEILDEVATGKCHILYLSPESLLSRSDIQQLIGTRKIGMLVVDEAHIVTTWGKQFRPDYWYLGDHVQKIRRAQTRRDVDPSPFIIATFTATAIYEGREDMYHETLNSLHMIDPITYLGYVKRSNISIEISEVEVRRNKTEYEINKFDALISMIKTALMRNQKVLIYFPTVALINRFYDYCYSKNLSNYVTRYHGQLLADEKDEGFKQFHCGEKMIMLATKAFGMGIDIPDISIVSHFAPTGNVCDYMQEIGRAARKESIEGHAIYQHMSNDFKHINRLHGLSAIQKYQLVEVIKKVLDIYTSTRYRSNGHALTKKRNEMLIDAESFSYIFESPLADDSDLINKVKTAMLLIQKDYENRGFAPFYMRPIPLFAYGYFAIPPFEQEKLSKKYPGAIKLVHHQQNVCEVNLSNIWEKTYKSAMSFPKFKYLLYTRNNEINININQQYNMVSAMLVELFFSDDSERKYAETITAIKEVVHTSIFQGKYFSLEEIVDKVAQGANISKYRAESIVGVTLAAMDVYQREYSSRLNARMYQTRALQNGTISYQFLTVSREFFAWIDKGYKYICQNAKDQKMYIVNDQSYKRCKEITTVLGILESFAALRFKALGGSNSQLYIYVNETKNMQMVRDKPNSYRNKLLELINNRHSESVEMLSFLFQNNLSSDEVWEHLENYFLGILPKQLLPPEGEPVASYEDEVFMVQLQVGENLKADYPDWEQVNMMFDNDEILRFQTANIPVADYYDAKLILGQFEINANLVWVEQKIALTSGDEMPELRALAASNGWKCVPLDEVKTCELAEAFVR